MFCNRFIIYVKFEIYLSLPHNSNISYLFDVYYYIHVSNIWLVISIYFLYDEINKHFQSLFYEFTM